jgi:hypothetical protein
VRIIREQDQIRDPVVARSRAKHVSRAQCGEDGEASRRSPCDRDSILVNFAFLDEVLDAGDRVLHVDDAPLTIEALAVGSTVAG